MRVATRAGLALLCIAFGVSTAHFQTLRPDSDITNLSSFYLPNSQLFFGDGILGSGPAIIAPPIRVSGSTLPAGNALFRPAFNQPFVQFPFIGGVGPNFGVTGNNIAPALKTALGTP